MPKGHSRPSSTRPLTNWSHTTPCRPTIWPPLIQANHRPHKTLQHRVEARCNDAHAKRLHPCTAVSSEVGTKAFSRTGSRHNEDMQATNSTSHVLQTANQKKATWKWDQAVISEQHIMMMTCMTATAKHFSMHSIPAPCWQHWSDACWQP